MNSLTSTTKFLSAVPVLPAVDIAATIAFYDQKLGFAIDFQSDDYAGLRRGGAQIHLWQCSDRQLAENTSCRINVSGIDAIYDEYQTQNVIHPNGAIATKLWGLREFAVLDPNGNCLTFAEPPATLNRRDHTD
ncbi:bleomycin resistance protein [Stenomitos frigidus]|uniref:Bleomycin resistance protein n=1 Tax=Stenomitos frigidus ULC18 TaxID=2107698 RepID=A0A2T1DU13_9CYAN|nr:VOC family protein [Stenomitos frigidus]PSB23921.1 glyoxalase [Stenomitos frigidus ULC18]